MYLPKYLWFVLNSSKCISYIFLIPMIGSQIMHWDIHLWEKVALAKKCCYFYAVFVFLIYSCVSLLWCFSECDLDLLFWICFLLFCSIDLCLCSALPVTFIFYCDVLRSVICMFNFNLNSVEVLSFAVMLSYLDMIYEYTTFDALNYIHYLF